MKPRGFKRKTTKEIAMATFCISMGTLAGLISLFLFYTFNLAIFGFNIGLILSPLIAGYVETYLAGKICGETTGAVSAFLLFIITVLYGFIFINTGLGINFITFGSAAIILQATFPVFINYFLIVVVLGVISYIFGFFKSILETIHYISRRLYFKILNKEYREETGKMDYNAEIERVDINKLGILFLTTTSLPKGHIKEFKGIFESKILIQEQISIIKQDPHHKGEILIKNLKKAREQALTNLASEVKKENCDAILDLTIEIDTLGGLTEDNIHIVARGTGVELV